MVHSLRAPLTVLFAGLFAAGVFADDLNVNGTITDADGNGIEGATVAVSTSMQGTPEATGTTDQNGEYSLDLVYEGGGMGPAMIVVRASADGFQDGFNVGQVPGDPSDGTPDTVTVDVTLQGGGIVPSGDSVYVSGTVTDGDGGAIEGATVTVTLGRWGGVTETATTDAAGEYAVATVNTQGRNSVQISVSADGYGSANETVTIDNPNDGTADVIVQDFTLGPIAYDTVSVSGSIVDAGTSDPIPGATVTLTYYVGEGMTLVEETASGTADSNGDVAFNILIEQGAIVSQVSGVAEAEGYQSEELGVVAVAGGAIDLGTIQLTPFTTNDSVTYTVSGIISDENGDGLVGAEVIVTIAYEGGADILVDTVESQPGWGMGGFNAGAYEVVSDPQAYQDGNVVVSVTVSAVGYEPATEQVVVPTSTSGISVDVSLVPEGSAVAWRIPQTLSAATSRVTVYGLDGRVLGRFEARSLSAAALGDALGIRLGQPVILRWRENGSVRTQSVVLPLR